MGSVEGVDPRGLWLPRLYAHLLDLLGFLRWGNSFTNSEVYRVTLQEHYLEFSLDAVKNKQNKTLLTFQESTFSLSTSTLTS